MSTRRTEALGAGLFIVLVLAGWFPFLLGASQSGMYEALPVLLGGVFAILAAGLTYDGTERLFGAGKGVYAAAAMSSLPAVGIVFSEPPLLTYASVMFVTGATCWFAARCKAENPREALFFIAVLSAIPLAVVGFWPPAFLPLLAVFIVQARLELPWTTVLFTLAVGLLGLAARPFVQFDLPEAGGKEPRLALSLIESLVLLTPWFATIVLSLFSAEKWPRFAALGMIGLAALHALFDGSVVALAGSAGPLIALCATASVMRWFDAESEDKLKSWRWTALALVLALAALTVARITKDDSLLVGRNHGLIALMAAILLAIATVRDARRWMFGLFVAGGWIIGALWWNYWDANSYADLPAPGFDIAPWLLVAALLFRAAAGFWLGRKMPKSLRKAGVRHKFDSAPFRVFSDVRRSEWEGKPVSVVPRDERAVRFAVFGDVTGSEFPFASRNTGYYSFKSIIRSIAAREPDFAISTGDLASRATHTAYRRLRMLLRNVPFPLLATPGNHDIVDRGVVHSQFFHALFGSDHADVSFGSVRLILINNAWGSLTDEQWRWTETTFAAPSSAAFTLVFCHKPVFDPRGGSAYEMEWRPHAERLHELFVKNKVSAVFSGHIHSLLQSERDGVKYIISGGGGSKLKSEADAHHYLWCEVFADQIRVTAFDPERTNPILDITLSPRS